MLAGDVVIGAAGVAVALSGDASFPLPPAAAPVLGPALGVALPKPHPPSLSWAGMTAAHLPLLKPQQLDAQSASEVQAPVMNCVPCAATYIDAELSQSIRSS